MFRYRGGLGVWLVAFFFGFGYLIFLGEYFGFGVCLGWSRLRVESKG